MKAFCPNCGTQNEGVSGGRVTCKACTASFEIPGEDGGFVAPTPQVIAPPAPVPLEQQPRSSQLPTGYVGPPPTGFTQGTGTGGTGPVNTLSIVSLVCGILCCIPFASIAAIATGAVAQQQIAASNGTQRGREYALAGMVLGGITLAFTVVFFLISFLGRLH